VVPLASGQADALSGRLLAVEWDYLLNSTRPTSMY
jgi:hypothetical protein